MGTDVHGYVEVNTILHSNENIWFVIVDIGVLAERNYEVFGQLFGIRAQPGWTVLAPGRGMPKDTNKHQNIIFEHEDIVGHTWASWSELDEYLKTFQLHPECLGWKFVFSSMRSLAEIYGSENVRIVVSFDSYG